MARLRTHPRVLWQPCPRCGCWPCARGSSCACCDGRRGLPSRSPPSPSDRPRRPQSHRRSLRQPSPLACLGSGSSAGGEAAWRFPLIVYSTDARCYSELSNANTRASATRVQGNDGWVASGELELLFVGDQNMGPTFQVTYGKIVRNDVLNSLSATHLRGEARRPALLRPGRRYPRYVIARFDPVAYDR